MAERLTPSLVLQQDMGNQSLVDGGGELTGELFMASDGEVLRHCVPTKNAPLLRES